MIPPLTPNCVKDIYAGNEIEKPIVQVLGNRKLGSGERYRLLVSDGTTVSSFTMLATQLNGLIEDGDLSDFTIIEITRYAMSSANNAGKPRRIMIILELDIKVKGSEVGGKLGNPIPLEKSMANGDDSSGTPAAPANTAGQKRPATSASANASAEKKRLNDSINSGTHLATTPIAALSPYQNRWVIKVRVSNKSDMRTWSNSRGEGKLFSMDLVDESGEIRCTAFRDVADKFFNMIEIGKIYYISRGQLKPANKQFNNLKNEYELTLNADSEIVACDEEVDDIPMINFEFKPISMVESLEKNEIIDVLGVVKETGEVQQLTARTTGRELRKRDLQLVDMSNTMVTLTLWGSQADNFDGSNHPVIAAKGVRVGEFNNGKNLSTLSSTVLQIDPDHPDAHRLRGWWTTTGHSQEAKSLSKFAGGGALVGTWMTIEEAAKRGASLGDSTEVFLCKAEVNFIRTENAVYKACPSDACNKKVIDQGDTYRCEKCNRDYPNFKYRILAQMNIADYTGSIWVTAFSNEAEKMFNTTAQELGELGVMDHDAYLTKYGSLAFLPFVFKLRMKIEVYNDEAKLKTIVTGVGPVDYKMYNKMLLDEIKSYVNFARIPSN